MDLCWNLCRSRCCNRCSHSNCNFAKIELNPLFYCLSTVTKKFSRITYINQVAYCYSIIDANNRVSLPIVSSTQTANNKRTFFSNQNDTFSTTNFLKSGEKESKKKEQKFK